jgi:enamine deaminase RidA (YjgF/YER057c/UK114 family)
VNSPLYPGTPYDYSAAARGLVFTAGACPLDQEGRIVAPGDFERRAPSTLLGVALLGYPDQLVEIEAIVVADTAA